MSVLAAPVLVAPADPGIEGLLAVLALVLIGALVLAHVRLLRSASRPAPDASRREQPVDEADPPDPR